MKKQALFLVVSFLFLGICYAQSVTIGSQVWSTKNLNVSTFCNGDTIPEAKTDEEWALALNNKQPAWCYYENNPENGSIYGKLYNWYAVSDARGLAPIGWHIPTNYDWEVLKQYLNKTYGHLAGRHLKSTGAKYWICPNTDATNKSGFSALPGGKRWNNGKFEYIGTTGHWWTTFLSQWGVYYYYLQSDNTFSFNTHAEDWGLSVRCIKD
jgi:uncharacterized protein (TIGR02145 family)